jgi:hypothetical protein
MRWTGSFDIVHSIPLCMADEDCFWIGMAELFAGSIAVDLKGGVRADRQKKPMGS